MNPKWHQIYWQKNVNENEIRRNRLFAIFEQNPEYFARRNRKLGSDIGHNEQWRNGAMANRFGVDNPTGPFSTASAQLYDK